MISTEFLRSVLGPIRELAPSVRLPDAPAWSVEPGRRAVLELTLDDLSLGLQRTSAAAPLFLLCMVLRLDAAGQPWRALVRLRASAQALDPSEDAPLTAAQRNQARSLYLLQLYTELFGDLFEVTLGGPGRGPLWRLPARGVLNQASAAMARGLPAAPDKAKHRLAAHFVDAHGPSSPRAQFARIAGPVGPFRRHLPMGLFRAGIVSRKTACIPAGKSAIDAWTTSPDGKTLHLLELKGKVDHTGGTLAEVLYYSTLLARYRDGDLGTMGPAGAALTAVRAARRITGWLAVPRLHPLLDDAPHTVISSFSQRLQARTVSLRAVRVDGEPPAVRLTPF
jgi:hypothetical protein